MKKLLILSLFLASLSCAKKASSPTTTNATGANPLGNNAAPTAAQCAAAADAASAASSFMGNMPTTQLALASLTIPQNALTVNNQYPSKNTPAVNIKVDYATLSSNTDYSSSFVMWKACSITGSPCSNNGQYTKDYHFNIANVSDLPVGVLKVNVRLCVDDLKFVVPSDRANARNACSPQSPCYCGKETTMLYTNTASPTLANPQFKADLANLKSAQQTLLNIAQSYINQANTYINSCKVADKKSLQLQYAQNIASYSATNLAGWVETYANYLRQNGDAIVKGAEKQEGFHLADCSSVATSPTSTGPSLDSLLGNGFGASTGTSSATYASAPTSTGMSTTPTYLPAGGGGGSASGFTDTGTDMGSSFALPTATSKANSGSSGSPVLLGLGITGIVVGVLATIAGITHYVDPAKFNMSRLGEILKGTAEESSQVGRTSLLKKWFTAESITKPVSASADVPPAEHPVIPPEQQHVAEGGSPRPATPQDTNGPKIKPEESTRGGKTGMIAGVVLAGIGGLLTYGGSGLAAGTTGSCGNFRQVMFNMESQLYNQYLKVQAALATLAADQKKAAATP